MRIIKNSLLLEGVWSEFRWLRPLDLREVETSLPMDALFSLARRDTKDEKHERPV
jgi:hypothetical protein